MGRKKAAQRRAAEKRAKRTRRTKPYHDLPPVLEIIDTEVDELLDEVWKQTDEADNRWAAAYLAQHGECAICRARVGVVSRSVRYVEAEPHKKDRPAH